MDKVHTCSNKGQGRVRISRQVVSRKVKRKPRRKSTITKTNNGCLCTDLKFRPMEGLTILRKIENMDKQLMTPVENNELLSPQRSITDFFKSPKRDSTYFVSSTPIEKDKKKILDTETENSEVIEKKKKSKKSGRENNKVEDLFTTDENVKNGINVEDDHDLDMPEISKRPKTKKKKSKKKKKDLDEDFIQHFDSIGVKSDTSTDDLNLSLKEKKKSKVSLNNVNSVKKHSVEAADEKVNAVLIVKNSKLDNVEEKCVMKRKRYSDVENTEQNTKRSKLTADDKSNPAKSNKNGVENISYEDYLKGLAGGEEGDDIIDSQSQESQSIELTPLPENYPSITKFFEKKFTEKNTKETAGQLCSPSPITVTADIHPEPAIYAPVFELFNKKSKSSSNQIKILSVDSPNISCISVESEEIVLLSSDIQEIEEENSKKSPKSNEKSLTMKNNSSVEIISSPKPARIVTKESKAFLSSQCVVKAPSRTSQATLSFIKNGPKTDKNQTVEDMSCTEVKKIVADVEVLTESENVVKKIKKTKKVKKTKMVEGEMETEDKTVLNADAENFRESSRKKYQVTSLQFDDNQKTPIKMKIRCRKSLGNTSGEDTEFTPKSLKSNSSKKESAKKLSRKLVKAQELLVKAKHHKSKKKSSKEKATTNVSKNSKVLSNRLSPRLASKPKVSMEEVIDLEEEDVEIITKNKTKPKTTKLQTNVKIESPMKAKLKKSTESPRKGSSNKLASIFTKKKAIETEPMIPKPPEDPEKVRLRQAFLSSGIPDEIKKQEVMPSTVIVISDYPPFPTVSHIQQYDDESMKNYKKFTVKVKEMPCFSNCDVTWKDLGLRKLYKNKKKKYKNNIIKFSRHEWLNEESCKKILVNFQHYHTSYHFQEMFDSCKAKKLEELKSASASGESTDTKYKIEVDGKNDTIIIDEHRVKKKKSKKKEKILLEDTTNFKKSKPEDLKIEELLWTERYQPCHSSEIIGNTSNINKLKTWLLEWKHKTHKDARKMKKLLTKQSKSSKNSNEDNGWLKEDSDFYSEDSDEEEDSLCNTMLITGPHGIGKTATVYALAQELGYKVFEVNTSSSRNGKKILSRLQEATQSHQVAQNKDGIPPPIFTATDNMPVLKKEPVKNKLPTAFTNLFNKAKPRTDSCSKSDCDGEQKRKNKNEADKVHETKKRKRETQIEIDEKLAKRQKKIKKDDEDEHLKKMSQLYHKDDSGQAGGLNLTSTSVILFDEADLVFEKDVGFISAVQYFMNTTKIPIILTTTSRNLANIQARFEVLRFDPPKSGLLVSHLQTLCLVEGVRTDRKDLHSLAIFYNNDVRKCMLALQFWVESGGGVQQKHQSIQKVPKVTIDVPSTNSQSPLCTLDSDDDDFIVPRQLCHNSASKLRIEYENSNSSEITSDNLPVHSLCFESILCLTNKICTSLEDHISQFLQGEFKQGSFISTMHCCDVLSSLRFNLLINNVIHLLPLPKTCLRNHRPVAKETMKRKGILNSEDCDSEASNSDLHSTNSNPSATHPVHTETKRERRNTLKCLKSFSSFYDNISLIDNIQTVSCLKDLDYLHSAIANKQEASVLDEMSTHQHPHFDMLQQEQEILNHIETRSMHSLCEDLKSIQVSLAKKVHDDDFLEKLSLPIANGITHFSARDRLRKSSARIEDAQDNIWANLPLAYTSKRTVKLDYLPYLRSIHRTECVKRVEKAKRRFHHHFDNIGFGLKKTTMSYLEQVLE